MKKLTILLSLLFFIINVLSIFIYFSLNVKLYVKYSEPSQITSSNITDLQNVYSFLQNKSDLNTHFTPLEISHMQDVKTIFSIVNYIFIVSLFIFIIIIVYLIYLHKYKQIFKWLFIWSIVSLSIMLLLLISTIFDFTSTFQSFHKIFFPQWNRTFAEDSRLITLFPESFFIAISQNIFITISAISTAILSIYFIIKKISQH
jgi:integral membrane protein (TIGR01906 family)